MDVDGDDGVVIDRYLRGITLLASDDFGYYLFNAHGDVVQIADGSGVVTKDYDYDAFGVQVDSDGGMRYTDVGDAMFEDADTNPWRYCGEYFDTETNTIYLRARYYDPVTGRFSSEDPIRAGLNWYTYCINNPIVFVDPWGLAEIAVRSTIEGLGGRVIWDNKTKKATVYLDGQKVEVYAGDKNGSYIGKDGRMRTDDGWLFKAMSGMVFELGKGWNGRIERHGSGNGYQKHVHIYNGKQQWSQNDDGSPHDDGKNSPGGPPKKILKSLKDKKGWDWNEKENNWINKCDIYLDAGGLYVITYPNGQTGYVPDTWWYVRRLRPYNSEIVDAYLRINRSNTTVAPPLYLPFPNSVPMPNITVPGFPQIQFPILGW